MLMICAFRSALERVSHCASQKTKQAIVLVTLIRSGHYWTKPNVPYNLSRDYTLMIFNAKYPMILLIGLSLSACSQDPEPPAPKPVVVTKPVKQAPQMRPVQAATSGLPSLPAHLRTLLPQTTLGYLRVPSFWGMLGSPF